MLKLEMGVTSSAEALRRKIDPEQHKPIRASVLCARICPPMLKLTLERDCNQKSGQNGTPGLFQTGIAVANRVGLITEGVIV